MFILLVIILKRNCVNGMFENQQVVVEEKKPAVQVNLAELLKQTGIVDDDESFFMDDEPTLPPPPPPPQQIQQQPSIQLQMEQPIPPTETKENNVMKIAIKLWFRFLIVSQY